MSIISYTKFFYFKCPIPLKGSKRLLSPLSTTAFTNPIETDTQPIGTNKPLTQLADNNVFSWTKLIATNSKMGLNEKALAYFSEMRRVGVEPNEMTMSTVIGICSRIKRMDVGKSLHCFILKMGLFRERFLSSGLITLYSKCDFVEGARMVFDEMPERDAVSWSSMIAAYSQKDLNEEAVNLFFFMLRTSSEWRLLVNNFTFTSILKACAGTGCIRIGKFVHNLVILFGFESDVFVAGAAADMYSKCGCLDMARRVFDRMGKRDLVAWNSMITGYAQNDCGVEVIELFVRLEREGFSPDETTFSCVLKASSGLEDSFVGGCFHAKAFTCGSSSDVYVGTAIVDMYSKYSEMELAERAFQDMIRRNLVSFNVLITGYSLTGRYIEALRTYMNLLSENIRPDGFTFSGLLSSFSVLGTLEEGAQVHCHSIKTGLDSNVTVGNSLVSLYAKCGLMGNAFESFKSIKRRNVVSWAALISGFAQNGEEDKALELFCNLHGSSSEKLDEFCLTSVLKAVASLAAVEQGRHVHGYIVKVGLGFTVYVGSALIDMYSKCGMVENSFKVFNEMLEKNVVSWNSMIIAYAQNGYSDKALLMFEEMLSNGVLPTCITFIGVLLACSHAGMVEEGKRYYNSMVFEYKIPPSIEHCSCMVDLLGRSGYVEDAETFILEAPLPSEPGLWRSLLSASEVHKNMDVAIRAAEQCLKLDPRDSVAYIILSNIYASKQLWHEVERIRCLMRDMSVEKEPGCSWVEVRNKVNRFGGEEKLHSPEVKMKQCEA